MGRALALTALLAALPGAAEAQPRDAALFDEPRARDLRDDGRRAVSEGRIEAAYEALRSAVELTADATAFRELAEVADHLRIDGVALRSYEIYLTELPSAEDRAEVEGRVRVLRDILRGARYVPAGEGHQVRLLVDWNGRPLITQQQFRSAGDGRSPTVLVDWQGHPLPMPRTDDGSSAIATSEQGVHAGPRGLIRVRFEDRSDARDAGLARRLAEP